MMIESVICQNSLKLKDAAVLSAASTEYRNGAVN